MLISGVLLAGNDWIGPDPTGWLLFVAAGTCSVIAWIGIIGGYRRASPAILSPFEYTALIGGAVAGYLLWDEIPDRRVTAGAAIIIAAGLFVVYREIGDVVGSRYLRASTASVDVAARQSAPPEKDR